MAEKRFKSLVLDSSFDEIEKLEPYLKKMQQWGSFSDDEFARIRLATNEAVTNAIVHGNKEDTSRQVQVAARLRDGTLRITVQDEGKGFDPSNLPDPLDEENLLNESGRGFFLIQQYANRVEFEKNPTRLVIYFLLDE